MMMVQKLKVKIYVMIFVGKVAIHMRGGGPIVRLINANVCLIVLLDITISFFCRTNSANDAVILSTY